MEYNLTDADFEPIDIDGRGNYLFSNSLRKLRRSIIGMHNKIQPVYVLNPRGRLKYYVISVAVEVNAADVTYTQLFCPALYAPNKKWVIRACHATQTSNGTATDWKHYLGASQIQNVMIHSEALETQKGGGGLLLPYTYTPNQYLTMVFAGTEQLRIDLEIGAVGIAGTCFMYILVEEFDENEAIL